MKSNFIVLGLIFALALAGCPTKNGNSGDAGGDSSGDTGGGDASGGGDINGANSPDSSSTSGDQGGVSGDPSLPQANQPPPIPTDLPSQPAAISATSLALNIDATGKVSGLTDLVTNQNRVTPLSLFQQMFCQIVVGGQDINPTVFETDGSNLVFIFNSLSPAPVVELNVSAIQRHLVVRVVQVDHGDAIERLRFVNLFTLNAIDALTYRFVSYHDAAGDRYLAICPLNIYTQTAIGSSGFLHAEVIPNNTSPAPPGFAGQAVALFSSGTDAASVFDFMNEVETLHNLPPGSASKQQIAATRSCFFWMDLPPAQRADVLQFTVNAGIQRMLLVYEVWADINNAWALDPNWGDATTLNNWINDCHAAGITVGAHTPVGICPRKSNVYVLPGADARLMHDHHATLAADVSASQSSGVIRTNESVSDWPLGAGLQDAVIDGEIIQYTSLQSSPPGLVGPFVRAKNQSAGLGAQSHAAGAGVDRLVEASESTADFAYQWDPGLSAGILRGADDIAATLNQLNFDTLYCDEMKPFPPGGYGLDLLMSTLYDRLAKKPLWLEASGDTGWLSWEFLGIDGQMDYSLIESNGFKSEVERNLTKHGTLGSQAYLTTLQLGWAEIANPGSTYVASPDDLEYLCARSLAFDRPMIMQVWYQTLPIWPNVTANLNLIKRFETARLGASIPESQLAPARIPGQDCMLFNVSGTETLAPVTLLSLPFAPTLRGFITNDHLAGARYATVWAVDGQSNTMILPGILAADVDVRNFLNQTVSAADTLGGLSIPIGGRIYIRLSSVASPEPIFAAALTP